MANARRRRSSKTTKAPVASHDERVIKTVPRLVRANVQVRHSTHPSTSETVGGHEEIVKQFKRTRKLLFSAFIVSTRAFVRFGGIRDVREQFIGYVRLVINRQNRSAISY